MKAWLTVAAVFACLLPISCKTNDASPAANLESLSGSDLTEAPTGFTSFYSHEDALLLAKLSAIVYQYGDLAKMNYTNVDQYNADLLRMKSEGQKLGYTLVAQDLQGEERLFTSGQVFAAIFQNKDRYILVYRGTVINSIQNWLADVTVVHRSWVTHGRVHTGFSAMENRLWPFVQKFFSQPEHRKLPLWISGHSAGAAIATLATSRLAHEFSDLNIEKIYVYAEPRVGDSEFIKAFAADGLDQKYIKFTLFNDLVNVVPLSLMGYFDSTNIVVLNVDAPPQYFNLKGSLKSEISFDRLVAKNFLTGLRAVSRQLIGQTDQLNGDVDNLTENAPKNLLNRVQDGLKHVVSTEWTYMLGCHDTKSYIAALQNTH